MDNLPIEIRDALPTDAPFILDNWIKQQYSGFTKFIPWKIYHRRQKALVLDLLASGARVLVACSPEDPDQIFGFVCFSQVPDLEQPIIHWIHTKAPFRKYGIAKALLDRAGVQLDGEKPEIICSTVSWICSQTIDRYRYVWLPTEEVLSAVRKEGNQDNLNASST